MSLLTELKFWVVRVATNISRLRRWESVAGWAAGFCGVALPRSRRPAQGGWVVGWLMAGLRVFWAAGYGSYGIEAFAAGWVCHHSHCSHSSYSGSPAAP